MSSQYNDKFYFSDDVIRGKTGATYTPSVSPEGIISWTNDRGLPNPEPQNIRGPKGDRGDKDYDDAIENLQEQIDDLSYEPIAISSFAVTPASAASVEIGSTVDNVNLAYSLNKEPTTLTLDGNDVPLAQSGTINLTNQGLTADKTYSLVATDSGSHSKPPASASKSAKVSFLSKIYYGLGSNSQTITDAFINGLTGVLASSRKRTVQFNPQGSQYIYFALPQGMCDGISFVVASGPGSGYGLAVTQERTGWKHTNASGGKVDYNVYKSMNPISSPISIEIR